MTTNVDMKQAVAGATVHFRCGGSAVVKNKLDTMYEFDGYDGSNNIDQRNHREHRWFDDGRFLSTGYHPIDIIRIDPPQFKWEDVRAGMAFNINGEYYFFIGRSYKDGLIFEDRLEGLTKVIDMSKITRAPEHDKVQP